MNSRQRSCSANSPGYRLTIGIHDLHPAYDTRLSAGGAADEWEHYLLRQGRSEAFKPYSQMELKTKRVAPEKVNPQANEMPLDFDTAMVE